MKIICVASSNRLEYLAVFLRTLAANRLDGWQLLLSREPCRAELHEAVDRLFADSGISFDSWTNPATLGPDANVHEVCSRAFARGADAIAYFDDDLELSPDALALCDWYLAREHGTEEAGICLCNEASDPERPGEVSAALTQMGLLGQGFCCSRAQWENFFAPNFWNLVEGRSFDWSLIVRALEQGRVFLRPRLSRTRHIGVEGLHGAAAGVHLVAFPAVIADGAECAYALALE